MSTATLKQPTKHQQRVQDFADSKQGTIEQYHKALFVLHDLSVALWTHQTIRPSYYYKFKTDEERSAWIASQKKSIDTQKQSHDQWAERLRAEKCNIKEGIVMYDSWGWEQTNIDFYKVVRKTDSTVWLQKLRSEVKETGFMSGRTWPTDEAYGEVIKRRIGKYGVKISDYRGSLTPYDGTPKTCSWYA
jgi:hypothetical protein